MENQQKSACLSLPLGCDREATAEPGPASYVWLVNGLGDAAHVVDLDLRILVMNDAFREWSGRLGADCDVIGKTIGEAWPFLDESVLDEYRQVIESGRCYSAEESTVMAGRTVITQTRKIPLFENGRVKEIVTILRDVSAHRAAERGLREHEMNFRRIADRAKDVVFRMSLPDGRFEYVSAACKEIFGLTPQDFYDTPLLIRELVHPDWREYFREHWEKLIKGDMPPYYEYQVIHADGSIRWVNQRNVMARDESGRPVALEGVVTDLTASKKADLELMKHLRFLENMERIEAAMRRSSDMDQVMNDVLKVVREVFDSDRVWLLYPCDPETSTWRVPYEQVREEYPGASTGDRDFPTDERVKAMFAEALVLGKPMTCDAKSGRRLDNAALAYAVKSQMHMAVTPGVGRPWLLGMHQCSRARVWSDEERKLFHAMAMRIRDGLDGLLAHRRLRESEEKFRAIAGSARDAIVMMDDRGTVSFWNHAAGDMFGWSEDETLGQPLHELLAPADLQREYRRGLARFQGTGEGSAVDSVLELVAVRKDGSRFPIELSIGRMLLQGKWCAVGIIRDVTERKSLQETAERAERLEAAGRIAGQVAHDFNNLLGPLVAYPDLIKEELSPGHPALEFVEPIAQAAVQMAEINQQLLTLGRRGHYNVEVIRINSIVEQVVDQFQPLPTHITLDAQLDPGLMNIKGGGAQVFRLLSNVVMNALDAMPGPGTLTVRTQNWYREGSAPAVDGPPTGEYVKITIADTGCGIPDDALGQVFEPFFTTKAADRKRGSGLGLSVVHAVAQDHGGFVDIDSTPGEGTSVYIYFPITRDEIAEKDLEALSGGPESILIVDDDRVQREVSMRLLTRLGYAVSEASGGQEALEKLGKGSYDLMIVDMIMPGGLDGADTYRRALALNARQRAIIVSGYAESDRVREARRLGAGDFVQKPLRLKTLAEAVRAELDRAPSD